MHILLTGGTGLIGRHLCPFLLNHHKVTVLTRDPVKARLLLTHRINAISNLAEVDFEEVDAVINLAGEPIVNKRWSKSQKSILRHSRIDLTKQISRAILKCQNPPHTLISGSAIGYYGRQKNIPIDESFNDIYPEFSHVLCRDWEHAALKAKTDQTRVCLLRTGVVLAKDGGALTKMLPAFRFALGGPIASGEQGMSWIHIDDMIQIILYTLKHQDLQGAINATAPSPVSNSQFSAALGQTLSRPAILPVPKFVLKMTMGEMADLLIYGQYVVPDKLLKHNFRFHYDDIHHALESLHL